MLDITNIPKYILLSGLYKFAVVQGVGVLEQIDLGSYGKPCLLLSEARHIIAVIADEQNGRLYFDTLFGKHLFVDITNNQFDPTAYDANNGIGSAAHVVACARQNPAFFQQVFPRKSWLLQLSNAFALINNEEVLLGCHKGEIENYLSQSPVVKSIRDVRAGWPSSFVSTNHNIYHKDYHTLNFSSYWQSISNRELVTISIDDEELPTGCELTQRLNLNIGTTAVIRHFNNLYLLDDLVSLQLLCQSKGREDIHYGAQYENIKQICTSTIEKFPSTHHKNIEDILKCQSEMSIDHSYDELTGYSSAIMLGTFTFKALRFRTISYLCETLMNEKVGNGFRIFFEPIQIKKGEEYPKEYSHPLVQSGLCRPLLVRNEMVIKDWHDKENVKQYFQEYSKVISLPSFIPTRSKPDPLNAIKNQLRSFGVNPNNFKFFTMREDPLLGSDAHTPINTSIYTNSASDANDFGSGLTGLKGAFNRKR